MDLESKRLKLKEITWADAEDVHILHSFSEVDECNTLGIPKNIDETKEIIRPMIDDQKEENRKLYFWKILLNNSPLNFCKNLSINSLYLRGCFC
jgi:ribosomal-protein-alanine N-acetyltransferase